MSVGEGVPTLIGSVYSRLGAREGSSAWYARGGMETHARYDGFAEW